MAVIVSFTINLITSFLRNACIAWLTVAHRAVVEDGARGIGATSGGAGISALPCLAREAQGALQIRAAVFFSNCSASVVGVALVAVGTRAGHCFEWSVVNDLTHGTGATRVNHLAEVLALPINATLQSRAVLVTAAFCRGRWRAESVRVSTVPFEALACCSAILHKTFRIGYTLLEVTRVHALSLTALLAVRALGVVLAA